MDHYQVIAEHFQGTIENIAMSVDHVAEAIAQGSELMTQVLLHDGKLLSCGNGADAALSQLFAACLVGRLDQERPALPVFNLSADSATLTGTISQETPAEIFSRPLRALGSEGDLLLALHTGGDEAAIIAAIEAAHERGMLVVVICCQQSTELAGRLTAADALIRLTAATRPQRIELQTMILNSLCQLIERNLFGHYNEE